MGPNTWIALAGLGLTTFLAIVGVIVWLVRLEGRVNANGASIVTLQADAKVHADTKLEVVRLQEQIKHLTDLIEKWLKPEPPPAPMRRRSSGS